MPGRRRKKSSAYRKAPLLFTESPVNEQKNAPSPMYSARHPLTADSVTVDSQFNLTWVSPQFYGSTQTGGCRPRRNKSASSLKTRMRQTQASMAVSSKRFLSKRYAPLKLLGDQTVTPPPSREGTPLRLLQDDSDELQLNSLDNSDTDDNSRKKASSKRWSVSTRQSLTHKCLPILMFDHNIGATDSDANEPNYVSESDVECQLIPQNSAVLANTAEVQCRLQMCGSHSNNRTPVRRSVRLMERYQIALQLMGNYMSSDDDSIIRSHTLVPAEILAPDTPESEYGRSRYSRTRYDTFVHRAKAKTASRRSVPFIGPVCTFEDLNVCAFDQDNNGDQFDWTRLSGPTPSIVTGPDTDHTHRTDSGHYLYTEVNMQRVDGDIARMRSPYYGNISNAAICVQFWNHLYGDKMGTLRVYLENATAGSPGSQVEIFNKTGNHGNVWHLAEISVKSTPSKFRIVFEAIMTGHFDSDMAIDDFSITEGTSCPSAQNATSTSVATDPPSTESLNTTTSPITVTSSGPNNGTVTSLSTDASAQTSSGTGGVTSVVSTSSTTIPVSNNTAVSCDFEQDLCGWTQETSDNGNWQTVKGVSANGTPIRYLQILAPSRPTPGYRYRMRSSTFSAQTRCLLLEYRLTGPNVGRLVVLYGRDQDDLPIWLESGPTTGWTAAKINLSPITGSNTATWLVIEAVLGTADYGQIRINNIQFIDGACI